MFAGRSHLPILTILLALNTVPGALARKDQVDTPLDAQEQSDLRKAESEMRSRRPDKAFPYLVDALNTATDVPKCLAIAAFANAHGFPLQDVKRQALFKGLSLSTSTQDVFEVAIKARQYQLYEVTREAVNNLIATNQAPDELYDLAKKAQEVALNDVAHLAMEKLYTQIKTVPDALAFARQARMLGMEDLTRKAVKDLIDDETNAHELMVLLQQIEPLQLKDLDRYCMKTALDRAQGIPDYLEVYNASKRRGEMDIFNVALYRGRKAKLMEQVQQEQSAAKQQLDSQQQQAQQDLSKPHNPAGGPGF